MKPGYKPFWICAALTATLAVAGLTPAAAGAGVLAQALEQAWSLHPQARALDARDAEARARAELAAGLTPAPAALSLAHLNDRLGDARGKMEWEVELSAPLWLPGQKAVQAAEASGIGDEIAARRAALRLQLAGQLRTAWWSLAAARQAYDLAQRRLNSALSLEGDVLRRYRVGDLARIDANHARSETLAAQTDSLAAEAAQRETERVWRNLTDMAAPSRLEAEMLPESLQKSLTDRTEPVLEHPDLIVSDSVLRLAQTRLKLVRTTRRDAPELALRLQRERGDSNEAYGNAIGVKLTIPFASGPRLRRDEAAARADANQAEAEQLRSSRAIMLAIEQARLDLETTQQQADLAQIRRELSTDTLTLAEKSFALGESNLTALLRARAAAFEAEAWLDRMTTARHRAVSQLKQARGEMP